VNPPTDKSRQFQNQEPGLRPNRALPPAAHRTATCGFVLDWGTAPPSLGRPEGMPRRRRGGQGRSAHLDHPAAGAALLRTPDRRRSSNVRRVQVEPI